MCCLVTSGHWFGGTLLDVECSGELPFGKFLPAGSTSSIIMKHIILTSFTFLLVGCVFNCNTFLNEEVKPKKIQGIIINKAKSSTGCFGKIFISNSISIDTIELCYCVVDKEQIWEYLELNDSISKPVGSIKIRVFRNGVKNEFTYPCCNR